MRSLFQRFDITDESGRVTSYVVRVAGSKDEDLEVELTELFDVAQRPSRRRGAQSQGIKVELPIVPSPLRSPFRDQLRRLAAPLAIP